MKMVKARFPTVCLLRALIGYCCLCGTSIAALDVSGIMVIIANQHLQFNSADMELVLKYAGALYPMAGGGGCVLDPWASGTCPGMTMTVDLVG